MKERPIIFSAHDVRAILAGRKAQTRRPMKPQPVLDDFGGLTLSGQMLHADYARKLCPFGQPGERLWVRETWAEYVVTGDQSYSIYHADFEPGATPPSEFSRWKPSIHMPRWASRIMLEVTGVRVERLQDISEADAQAEGATGQCPVGNLRIYNEAPLAYHFAQIWEQAHPNTWDQNPWVWVIYFRVIENG